jgi:hypothetical protein
MATTSTKKDVPYISLSKSGKLCRNHNTGNIFSDTQFAGKVKKNAIGREHSIKDDVPYKPLSNKKGSAACREPIGVVLEIVDDSSLKWVKGHQK